MSSASSYANNEEKKNLATAPPPPPLYPSVEPATGVPVMISSTNHPTSFQPQHQSDLPLVPWSTGLCDCFDDVSNCCITCWCPCITFGQISEIVDKGSSSCGVNGALYTLIAFVTGCPCLYSCFYRTKMRKNYNIEGSGCCADFLIHCCCDACALCQEYRELKNRGFDVSLGWHGNLEKRNGVVRAPTVQGNMER